MKRKKTLSEEAELRERLWAKVGKLPMFPDWAKKRLNEELGFIGWRQALNPGELQFDYDKLLLLEEWLWLWEAGKITPEGGVKLKGLGEAKGALKEASVAAKVREFDPREFAKAVKAERAQETKAESKPEVPAEPAAPASASEAVDLGALLMEAKAASAPPVRRRQTWETVLPLYRTLRERGFTGRQAMDWLVQKKAVPKEGRSSAAGWLWWKERKGAVANA